jgi:hypothetical protein
MRSLLAKRQKEQIFQGEIPADQEAFLKNQERPDTEEISTLIEEVRAKSH